MRNTITAMAMAGLLVGSANAQLNIGRIYFDVAGSYGDAAPHPGLTSKENPTVGSGERLYLYWEFGAAEQQVLGAGVHVNVYGGTITEAWLYNNPNTAHTQAPRYSRARPNPAVNPGSSTRDFVGLSIFTFGVQNGPHAELLDTQYSADDGPFGSTLLGYVDIETNDVAEVFLQVHRIGIAVRGGGSNDLIHFGFGDDPVGVTSGAESSLADARVVPEPGGLMLLACGVIVLLRRR